VTGRVVGDFKLLSGGIKIYLENEADGSTRGAFLRKAISRDSYLLEVLKSRTSDRKLGEPIFFRRITMHGSSLRLGSRDQCVAGASSRPSALPNAETPTVLGW
jgi:hypothetical protein